MIIMKFKKKRKYYLLYFPTIKLNEWMKERKKRNENRSDGKRNRRTLYTTNQRLALDWMIGWVLCGSRSRCEEECKWAVREQRLLITRSNREVSCAERNCLPPLVFCLSVCLGLVLSSCVVVFWWQVWRRLWRWWTTHTQQTGRQAAAEG